MALVKFGGGVVSMSGSIAGNTYARNRYGNYARARTKPVNPRTDRQNDIRAAIAFLSDRWAHTLDADQRIAWNDYGDKVNMKNRLGEVIHLTGYNHYIRSNAIREMKALAPIDAGPTVFELPAQDPDLSIVPYQDFQLIHISFDNAIDWAVEDGAYLFCFQGAPQNRQRNFFAGPWRHIVSIAGIAPGGAVTPDLAPVAFPIAAPQRQWIYARIQMADGRLSEEFRADGIVREVSP